MARGLGFASACQPIDAHFKDDGANSGHPLPATVAPLGRIFDRRCGMGLGDHPVGKLFGYGPLLHRLGALELFHMDNTSHRQVMVGRSINVEANMTPLQKDSLSLHVSHTN